MKTLRWPATVTALAAAMLLAAVGCERSGALPPASAPAVQSAPVAPAAQGAPSKAADVTAARLAAADPDQWLTPGRDADGTYYSPL
ncbi:MAG TPA: hypothetical protein VK715_06755, partial [Steroidobacteraceae bacterium]|nr:hypothetical protein [Steroidobacteraceae bacterium]